MCIFQLCDKFPITAGLEHNFQQLHCFTFGESSISPFGIIAPRLEMKTTIFRMDYCQRSTSEAYFQKTLTCFQKAKSPPNRFFFQARNPKSENTYTNINNASCYSLGEVLFCMQILISGHISVLLHHYR